MKKQTAAESYLQEQISLLKAAKPNTKLGFTIIYDVIWYILLVALGLLFITYLNWLALKVGDLPLDRLTLLSPEQLAQALTSIKAFAWASLAGFIILLIAMLCALVLFKGLVWSTITNERLTGKKFLKIVGLRTAWALIWIIPLIGLLFIVQETIRAPLAIIWMLIALHFTIPFYVAAIKNPTLNSLSKPFSVGTKKIGSLILPYVISAVLFVIINIIFNFMKSLPGIFTTTIAYIIFLCFFAWVRWYVHQAYVHHD